MEPRLLLCLMFISVLIDVGHGRPGMATSISNPNRERHHHHEDYNLGTSSNREHLTQTTHVSGSQQIPVPVFQARSTMDDAPSTLNLASMVKNVMKDTKSAKKVILLPSNVYMVSPEAMLKGKRRYGGASIGGKGIKYGNNGGGGQGQGGYNGDAIGNGQNYLEGAQEGNYGGHSMGGNEGYNDNMEYDDDDDEYDAGQTDEGYQDGNNIGENEQGGQYDEGSAQGNGHQGGGNNNHGEANIGNGGGYGAVQQQYGNNAGGEVPTNEIGPGIYGRYSPVGEQFNKKYDTLFREFVLNFFINKYNLKTELPP